jgi:nitroreductase
MLKMSACVGQEGPDRVAETGKGNKMNESVLDVMRKRRTIRAFTEGDVSEEYIDVLLEMAMCAPNRLDRQPWHFVVIRDKALQSKLADLLRVHPYLEEAPVLIAVCGLPHMSPTWLMDLSAATENMTLAATAMGLGTAWVASPDTVVWNLCEEFLHDQLAIPLDVRIATLVAVGYPAVELPAHGRHDRFDRTKVHYGRWGNLNLADVGNSAASYVG